MNKPKVSIIMGIYNCEDTLPAAIDSIVNQTYDNWELVMCDDASTDDTYNVANSYVEKYPDKMVLLRNAENMRLSYSLNKCLEKASGPLIARMDGDDISKEDRLAVQVDYLLNHTEYQVVGTAMQRFDENGYHDIMHPKQDPDRMTMRVGTPFFHATIMTYKYVYDKLNGYTVLERTKRAQDHDLWFRFYSVGFSGNNIDKALYYVRDDGNAIRRRTAKGRIESFKTTVYGYKLLGFPKRWLLKPAMLTFIKCLVPYKIIEWNRNRKS